MKSKNQTLSNLIEFIRINKKLVIAFTIALIGMINIQYLTFSSTPSCLGIADSKEFLISFETPVRMKRVFVYPGEWVHKGQALFEVDTIEINLKLMKLQTEIKSLMSEEHLRSSLVKSFYSKEQASLDLKSGKDSNNSPLRQEILGLQKQINELKRLQDQSIQYAQDESVVASVHFRNNEQIPPFQTVISLTPQSPNFVSGFIHENHISDFHVGDEVQVESLNSKNLKRAYGKVASLGSRIIDFPERMQMTTGSKFWGRELLVSLPYENNFLMGEKVQIRSLSKPIPVTHRLGMIANAKATVFDGNKKAESKVLALGLPLESSGLTYDPSIQALLSVSDEDGPNQSPFWFHSMNHLSSIKNLKLKGLDGIEDVESLSTSEGFYYAMSSMGLNKNDKVKEKRGLLIRFKINKEEEIEVDRRFYLRNSFIDLIKKHPELSDIHSKIESDLDIESLSIFEGDAYFALKSPQVNNSSSVIFKLNNFKSKMDSNNLDLSQAEVYSYFTLKDERCENPSRITDLIKTKTGLIIMSNCHKPDSISQIWWLSNNAPAVTVNLVASLDIPKLEAMALVESSSSLVLASDGGKKLGSDYFQIQISKSLYEFHSEIK